MPGLLANNQRFRKSFASIQNVIDIPNLIDIQKNSYAQFLQAEVPASERKSMGLQAVFKSVFPITDFNDTTSLEFVSYSLKEPKYDVNECRQRGMTFEAPIKVVVRLVVWDKDAESGEPSIRDVKEQEVYFGEIPLMTENGTFIINGTERVVVSQLHRSPGVFFELDKTKTQSTGKVQFTARVIPNRGSWLDFEFDTKELLYVRIDRRRKLPATILLRSLGLGTEELLNYFYQSETITIDGKNLTKTVHPDLLYGQKASFDVKDPQNGEILIKKGRKFTKGTIRKIRDAKIDSMKVLPEEIFGRISSHDIADPKTGEVLLECNQDLTEEKFEIIRERGIKEFQLLFIDHLNVGSFIRDTLLSDKVNSMDEALIEIYRRLRPGDPPTPEIAKTFFHNLFFNADRYDLSKVGRLKLNHKFGFNLPITQTTLTKEDILETVRVLVELKNGRGSPDDIDHLGNRRMRAVGELLENQFRVGLVRMERAIKERMSLQEIETLMPNDLINAKPVSAVIKEFFGSSQLSQFMDQTNPLSEITHKRRLSALGPGGLTRERAGFEVRDVHTTHYGRICPIETPEGPNIGLIASLSTYARVNEYGFIETPYRTVKDNSVTGEVRYFSALEEEGHIIAQGNVPLDVKNKFTGKQIAARKEGEFAMVPSEEVDLMDVSAQQLVSVAASLIPFLEHDDANRALMGSNMQRQAVPLLKSRSPLIGTGLENVVARDSGVTVVARRDGLVASVDATRIVVKSDADPKDLKAGAEVDIYNLTKFRRSNQNTCINQEPIVRTGDYVRKGDVIADGPATEMGELALGQNVVVAFMSWGGYNFEDSILISEKVVQDDTFTSIHIEEFEVLSRDTKLGPEEITRDIPNVGEEALKDLDESGIVRIGAEVKPGDILVGKVTPKGETQLSPEEKLLRAIFGEHAGDVRDTSLRVPPGVVGTIIDAQVFSREGVEKDSRSRTIEEQETIRLKKDQEDQIKIIRDSANSKIKRVLMGQTAGQNIENEESGTLILGKGKEITEEVLRQVPIGQWADIVVKDAPDAEQSITTIMNSMADQVEKVRGFFESKIARLKKGDELPPGVIKMVKVYVAIKRKLAVGDKMAGRHGNKGVVSRILPVEDMPYMDDGTPVDLILNPLGVPSRMNIGQVLETHLGAAARGLGKRLESLLNGENGNGGLREIFQKIYGKGDDKMGQFVKSSKDAELRQMAKKYENGIHLATPVFDGAGEGHIDEMLQMAGFPLDGRVTLYDGRSGEAFDQNVTVGVMYMMKLHHLVDDKIHARSIGPYSLVTQQPLGGKAQFGGQRLGEMEVWALEAYGAAYTLQEFLTVKSDDVQGRTRMYEAIVKGDPTMEPGIPESFNVLVRELMALGLDVNLFHTVEAKKAENPEATDKTIAKAQAA